MYQISSKTGVWHVVEADMPGGDAARQMWRGDLQAATRCGRQLTPVNFYGPGEKPYTRSCSCAGCYPA